LRAMAWRCRLLKRPMKTYQIVSDTGELVAMLTCDGLLFDFDHQQEHVIPADGVQAVRLILGDGFKMEECAVNS
jgi:hypothetical protein